MSAIDWTKNAIKYKGQWVAMLDDEITVIASANSAKEALQKARKKGFQKPILFKVPLRIMPYVGSFWYV